MRYCQFILVWVFTASRCAAAEMEFSLDEPLYDLDTEVGAWDADTSMFAAHSDDLYSTTAEDNIFPVASDPLTAVSPDNLSICIDENQPSSRIRARSGVCVDETDSSHSGTVEYDPRLPGTLAEQDRVKKQWCPGTAFQGILDIPVCSQYEDIQILPSDLTDLDTGWPLTSTGLKTIVTAKLSMSSSPFLAVLSI